MNRSQNETKEKEQVLFATQKEQELTIQSLYKEIARLSDTVRDLQLLEKCYLENKITLRMQRLFMQINIWTFKILFLNCKNSTAKER
ncbi:hypothetical protein JS44_15160 [Anoxybacillus flavithermus]|uniref:Uncharacterized protein n=1 Tax=Anoxybacillus flavithermus TaxID=33934 RepID=A0A094J2B5_9BACL|nr:hypothetical protein JS44_15160 [Anoxybacillus flavithermus]